MQEAAKLGIRATDEDVRQYLHTGPTGEVLFPNGKVHRQRAVPGSDCARALTCRSRTLKKASRRDIIVRRLQALITAGVTVSDQEVREAYRKQNLKIKFDYAVHLV